jgi:hypothetical protein
MPACAASVLATAMCSQSTRPHAHDHTGGSRGEGSRSWT